MTITPGGLYVYHRERLPAGFGRTSSMPKDGDQVWTTTNGDYNSATSGKVFVSSDPALELPLNKETEFSFESDGRIEPGAVVYSDAGDFLGIVTTNKGSVGVCESAASIISSVERTKLTRPKNTDPSKSYIAITDPEAKKWWTGTIIRGVVIAPADVLDRDVTKLVINEGEKKQTPIVLKAGVKVHNDRLALLWFTSPTLPSEGLTESKDGLIAGDFCRTFYGAHSINGTFIQSGAVKPIALHGIYETYASRVANVGKTELTLEWFANGPNPGEAVLDVGGHWVGINLTLDQAKQGSVPNKMRHLEVIKAAEILRLIEEETKKLPAEVESPPKQDAKTP